MRTWDSTKRVKCEACRGAGRATPYYGMGGDHDAPERDCSKCRGQGHLPKPAPATAPVSPPDERPAPLTLPDLASALRAQAGAAYAAGDDALATRLREAATIVEGSMETIGAAEAVQARWEMT